MAAMFGSRPVAERKERTGGGDQKDREQKEGGEGIDSQLAGAERQPPVKGKGCRGMAEEELSGRLEDRPGRPEW